MTDTEWDKVIFYDKSGNIITDKSSIKKKIQNAKEIHKLSPIFDAKCKTGEACDCSAIGFHNWLKRKYPKLLIK